MSIQFPCPHCTEVMTIPERFAGTSRICPNCRGELTAPEPSEENQLAARNAGTFLGGSSDPSANADDDDGRNFGPRRSSTSRAAIVAAICGLASFPVFFLAIPGLLIGFIGRAKIRRSDGRLRGIYLAWAGIMLSVVSLVLYSTFIVTLGGQARQTIKYAHGRYVTTHRMAKLHEGMQAVLVRGVVLPPTLKTIASRGKLSPDAARPAIGDADFVYLGAGRTESAMNAEHILLYWPLLTERDEILCLFGDGEVRSVSSEDLNWLLQRQGDRIEDLKSNNLLPQQLLEWLRETEKAKAAPPTNAAPST